MLKVLANYEKEYFISLEINKFIPAQGKFFNFTNL